MAQHPRLRGRRVGGLDRVEDGDMLGVVALAVTEQALDLHLLSVVHEVISPHRSRPNQERH